MKHSQQLEKLSPTAQFRSQVSVEIKSDPDQVLPAFESVTPRDMPIATLLGEIRYLPGRLLGKKPPSAVKDEPFSRQLNGLGSLELYRSPEEIVIGCAGKLHQITDQEFVAFKNKAEFLNFSNPNYQRLFISIRVEKLPSGKSKLILEHWTEALSDKSKRLFSIYWMIIKPMGNLVSKMLLNATKKRAEVRSQEPVLLPT